MPLINHRQNAGNDLRSVIAVTDRQQCLSTRLADPLTRLNLDKAHGILEACLNQVTSTTGVPYGWMLEDP